MESDGGDGSHRRKTGRGKVREGGGREVEVRIRRIAGGEGVMVEGVEEGRVSRRAEVEMILSYRGMRGDGRAGALTLKKQRRRRGRGLYRCGGKEEERSRTRALTLWMFCL